MDSPSRHLKGRLRASHAKLVALASVLMLSLAASGIGVVPSVAAPGMLKLSVLETTPGFFDLPLYAMIHEGFAKANHLSLGLAQFQTGSGSSSQIFAGGTGDLLMGGLDAPVRLDQSGTVNVTVIGTMLQRGVFVLVSKAGSPYRTLQSLKGQVVGISGPGAFSDVALRYALKQNGMEPTDVRIAGLGGTPAQYAALEAGRAAAVQLQSPLLETALAQHKVQPIYDFRIAQGLIGSLVFTARTAAVRANPAPYAAFMRSYREVLHRFQTDPSYAMEVATKEWGTSTSAANLKIELNAYLRTPGIWSIDGVFTKAMYDRTRAMFLRSGQFKTAGFPSFRQLTQYAPKVQ